MGIEEKSDGKCLECGATMIITGEQDLPMCSACKERIKKKFGQRFVGDKKRKSGVFKITPRGILPGTKRK